MYKKIVSLISVMMVMTTIRAFDFPLSSLTSKIGSNVSVITDNEDDIAAITIQVDINDEGQDTRGKTVELLVTGFSGDQVFWNGIEVTDTYKQLDLNKIEKRSLILDCEAGYPGKATGSIKYQGFDQDPEVVAYFQEVPNEISNYCTGLGATMTSNGRRLILI